MLCQCHASIHPILAHYCLFVELLGSFDTFACLLCGAVRCETLGLLTAPRSEYLGCVKPSSSPTNMRTQTACLSILSKIVHNDEQIPYEFAWRKGRYTRQPMDKRLAERMASLSQWLVSQALAPAFGLRHFLCIDHVPREKLQCDSSL